MIINSKTGSFWKKKFSKEQNVCCTLVEKIENLLKDPHLLEKRNSLNNQPLKKTLPPKINTVIERKIVRSKKNQKAPLLAQHNYIINKL